MPIVVWRNCIGKNLQGKCGNGLTETVVPKMIPKSGEKKGCRLAADACKGEQNSGDDSAGRCLHHDMDDCFPTADAKGEGSFAVSVWHKKNNFLSGAQNKRNHDQSQGEPTGVRRKAFEPQHDQTIDDDTPGDRRNAVQNVGKEAQNRIEPGPAVFRQVNSPQNTDRYSDDPGKSKQFQRADDCVRHSAAKRSDWRG